MQNFRKLLVWERAHGIALEIERITARRLRRANASLAGQMRRAALSVPANIVEGCGSNSDREFGRFTQIAIASTLELEYHCEFAGASGALDTGESKALQERIIEVRRMLIGLRKRLIQSDRR